LTFEERICIAKYIKNTISEKGKSFALTMAAPPLTDTVRAVFVFKMGATPSIDLMALKRKKNA
jgi:hypothetical protein